MQKANVMYRQYLLHCATNQVFDRCKSNSWANNNLHEACFSFMRHPVCDTMHKFSICSEPEGYPGMINQQKTQTYLMFVKCH